MPSRKVVGLARSSAHVAGAAREYARLLAERLEPTLAAGLEPGESLPDVALFVRLLGRSLERELQTVTAQDVVHDRDRRTDRELRGLRDRAKSELRARLVEIRQIVRAGYGPSYGDRLLCVEGRIGRNPVVLLRQARDVVAGLEAAAAGRWPPPRRLGTSFDAANWEAVLRAAAAALAAAHEDALKAGQARLGAWVANQESYAGHRLGVTKTTRVLESLLEAADLPIVARDVRLRRRRRRRARSGDDEGAAPIPPGQEEPGPA